MEFKVTIEPANVEYTTSNNLLEDALSQSIPLEHSCKTGNCGLCSAEILSGNVENENGEIVDKNYVLTCKSRALSDVILSANYYPELVNIEKKIIPCKVDYINKVTEDVVIVKLRLPPTANFDYLSGQYVDLIFKGIKRSYSIANAKKDTKEIELHIRKVPNGKMSELLFGDVQVNTLMRIEGPNGTFFVRDNDKPLILIATGTGIAPIKSIVEQLISKSDNRSIYVYWGMRYKSELYCKEFYKYSERYDNINFIPVLSNEQYWDGHKGYVQNAVIQDFDSLEGFEVYACGSFNMINDAKILFENSKLSSGAFHSDAFLPAQ